MWDSLKNDWNRVQMMWLGSGGEALNLSWIESEKTIESNQIKKQLIQIGSKMVIIETAYANDGVRGGGSDVPMGRLVIWRCAHGDRSAAEIPGL